MKSHRTLRAISFFVTVVLILLIIKRIGASKLASVPSEVSFPFLSATLSLNIPFILLKSYKWYRIARMTFDDMRFKDAVSSFLIGISVSLFTPARMGELARVVVFKRDRRRAFMLAIIDKLTDVVALGLLFTISMFLLYRHVGMILGVGGLLVLITFAIWWQRSSNFHTLFFIFQLLVSLLCFLLLMLQFYMILLDLSEVRFIDVLIGLPLILMGSMLPITVSGLGLREMVASVILTRFGIAPAQAVGASFLLFIVNGLIPGLIGLSLWWILSLGNINFGGAMDGRESRNISGDAMLE